MDQMPRFPMCIVAADARDFTEEILTHCPSRYLVLSQNVVVLRYVQ